MACGVAAIDPCGDASFGRVAQANALAWAWPHPKKLAVNHRGACKGDSLANRLVRGVATRGAQHCVGSRGLEKPERDRLSCHGGLHLLRQSGHGPPGSRSWSTSRCLPYHRWRSMQGSWCEPLFLVGCNGFMGLCHVPLGTSMSAHCRIEHAAVDDGGHLAGDVVGVIVTLME